jgi:hypothetical protein
MDRPPPARAQASAAQRRPDVRNSVRTPRTIVRRVTRHLLVGCKPTTRIIAHTSAPWLAGGKRREAPLREQPLREPQAVHSPIASILRLRCATRGRLAAPTSAGRAQYNPSNERVKRRGTSIDPSNRTRPRGRRPGVLPVPLNPGTPGEERLPRRSGAAPAPSNPATASGSPR